jgi:insertion element IS1 protein InsB
MVSVPVQCPPWQSTEVIKAGKQPNGTQRSRCHNEQCTRRIFLFPYQDRGRVLEIRRQVVDMAIKGSGLRDTARVLRLSPTTGIAIVKKPPRFDASTPCSSPPAGGETQNICSPGSPCA